MNNRTYEFNYDETVTSAGTVAGRIVSYDIVFSDPVPTDNASLITSGTLSDARLSSNVPLKNTVNIFTQNQTINGDVEVTDSTKGIILKSGNNTRWRITITDSGTLQRVALSILAITMLAVSSMAQTVTDVVVGTNGVLVAPTNFFTANLPNWSTSTNPAQARTNLGLGSAATNDGSAFQPASANLTNLASNNAINLTNFPALLLRTNGSAAGLTSFPTLNQNTTGTASNVTGVVAITNGGTGTNTAGGARTNLGLGATNNVTFSNITASGTLAVTGNTVLSGVNNTATAQTADSASSLMTRSLVDTRMVDYIMHAPNRFRNLTYAMASHISGPGTAVHAGPISEGRVNVRIVNGSTNSFGSVKVNRQGPWNGLEGSPGVDWSRPMSLVVMGSKEQITNNVTRAFLVFGASAGDNDLPTNGHWVALNWVNPTNAEVLVSKAGVVTTNATVITTSRNPAGFGVWIDHKTNGTGDIYYAERTSIPSAALQKPTNATVTYSNGPMVISTNQTSLTFGLVGLSTNVWGGGFEIVGLNNAVFFAP